MSDDDLKLYTSQQSREKLDEISSILKSKFGDKWKIIMFLYGLLLFFIVLLIIFGIDFGESHYKDHLDHIKAFLVVLFMGVGFFCIWVSILPSESTAIYGIVPMPTMNAIIPVDNTTCGVNPTLCDENGECGMCIDKTNVNNYGCVKIETPNVYYLGTPLQQGKNYCLPKVEDIKNIQKQCGTYTGKIIWGQGDQGQVWQCQCLYPDIFSDSNQGCLLNNKCQRLVDRQNKDTYWDPLNMPSSLVGVTPYEKMPDGSPRFVCDCVYRRNNDPSNPTPGPNDYYVLPEDPFICHSNPCYAGGSSDKSITTPAFFDVSKRMCNCGPNTTRSNVSGFCYPTDSDSGKGKIKCNPNADTGGCMYGIIPSVNDQNIKLFFRKGDKVYVSDVHSDDNKTYFIDVTENVNRLNLNKNKIINIDETIMKDAFYAFPQSTIFSGGDSHQLDGMLAGFDQDKDRVYNDMVTILNKIAENAAKSSNPGIPVLCNSFFYTHDGVDKRCQNQLSKTGTEVFPNFDKPLSEFDCGKDNGNSLGLAHADIFNKKGYYCVCNDNSILEGDICIPCVPNGTVPPMNDKGEDINKCCSNNASGTRGECSNCDGGSRKSGILEPCDDNCNCKDGRICANNQFENGDSHKACCPYGADNSLGFATWCINLKKNDLCKHNFQCESDNCDGYHCT